LAVSLSLLLTVKETSYPRITIMVRSNWWIWIHHNVVGLTIW
jgi:hypothetical protein